MTKIPIIANPGVYEIVDFTARQFLDDCGGDEYFARACLLNQLMRRHIFTQLLCAFGDEKILEVIFQSTETAYNFYVKYLRAVRGQDGYRLHKDDGGRVVAIGGPNGYEFPNGEVLAYDSEPEPVTEETVCGELYLAVA